MAQVSLPVRPRLSFGQSCLSIQRVVLQRGASLAFSPLSVPTAQLFRAIATSYASGQWRSLGRGLSIRRR